MEIQKDLFTILKKNHSLALTKKTVMQKIYFQILFDEQGALLRVIDLKGKAVEVEYEYFSGYERQVIKGIRKIEGQNSLKINWGAQEGGEFYLGENDFIIWPLQHCSNVVDENLNPIHFTGESGTLVVEIVEEKDKILQTRILVKTQSETCSNFRFLSETYILIEGKVYQIDPVGDNYNLIGNFTTTVFANRRESYLSLLFSYFDNLTLEYQDYTLKTGEPRSTDAALIIEEIDLDKALYLRVSSSIEGFDPGFLEDYEISRVVTCNDLEQLIVVRDVIREPFQLCLRDIEKKLKSHSQNLKEKKDFQLRDQNLFIIEENLARQFIFNELTHLLNNYTVIGAEKLKVYKVRTVLPILKLNLSHGLDFLEGSAELDVDGQLLPLFDVINQYNRNSYITLNDGTHAIINRSYIQKLKRIFKKQQEQVKLSFFDLPLVEELLDAKISGEAYEKSREVFLGFNKLVDTEYSAPPLQGELRDYQKLGFKWLVYLKENSLGGCLADDMGLGKTIQTIALLSTIYPAEETNSLVIMPRSLLFNWENEIRKFNPVITTYIYHGTGRVLADALKQRLILTTYATVRNDIKQLKELNFYYLILDESQNIKNMTTHTTKAVLLLNGRYRLALSGTPVENHLGELYALFRFLNPPMFGTQDQFHKNYAKPIQNDDDKTVLHELKKRIYPFILRRLKRDVVRDLPEKIEQILYVDMNDQQKIFYEQRRKFFQLTIDQQIRAEGISKSQFYIFQAMTELRQIASIPEIKIDESVISAKQEVLAESILDAIANGHKILVFANFLGALNSTATTLDTYAIPYLHMTGATQNRQELVNKFQQDPRYKVFLMTLKTGGIGLNLTAADCVYIYDPWWNVAAENQAVDRAHRIGQDKTVFCYKLIARGTIEEKILKLQEIKRELFDALIASDGASLKSLSAEDVEFILGE